MNCCEHTCFLGCYEGCQEFVTLGENATQTGTHEVVLHFNDNLVKKTFEATTGEPLVVPNIFPEFGTSIFQIKQPDGSEFTKDSVDQCGDAIVCNCFTIKTGASFDYVDPGCVAWEDRCLPIFGICNGVQDGAGCFCVGPDCAVDCYTAQNTSNSAINIQNNDWSVSMSVNFLGYFDASNLTRQIELIARDEFDVLIGTLNVPLNGTLQDLPELTKIDDCLTEEVIQVYCETDKEIDVAALGLDESLNYNFEFRMFSECGSTSAFLNWRP